MELQFTRSGGFSGMATQVAGTVVFNGNGATVTSGSTKYNHPLTADEAARLRRAAEKSKSQALNNKDTGLRDAFQYDLQIRTNDGRTSKLQLQGDSSDPDIGFLINWVREECDRIWDFRIHENP